MDFIKQLFVACLLLIVSSNALADTPPAATLIAPDGEISTRAPTYTWNAVSDASWYYLWVNDSKRNTLIHKWYTSEEAGCTAGKCSVASENPLAVGGYTWWIQTWSDAGYGDWSGAKQFNVVDSVEAAEIINGNFTRQEGVLGGGIEADDDPATARGVCFKSLGFCSQAKRAENDIWPESSGNTFSLQTGSLEHGEYGYPNLAVASFSGDPDYGIEPTDTWFYANGNAHNGQEYLVWGQAVSGLTVGKEYTFSFYANNIIEPNIDADDPLISVKTGGDVDLPNGSVAVEPRALSETPDEWVRIEYVFTATSSKEIFKITNQAASRYGDDLAITAISLHVADSAGADVNNGNFANQEGTQGGGIEADDDPATARGTCFKSIGFCSQAKRAENDIWPESSANTFSLQTGSLEHGEYGYPNLAVASFSGDPDYGIEPTDTWLYTNGNAHNGQEYLVWGQALSGLTVGKEYTFSFYANNIIEPNIDADDPLISVKTGGDVDLPNGTVAVEPRALSETPDEWVRIEYVYTATSSHEVFKITNQAASRYGDDLAITAISNTTKSDTPELEIQATDPVNEAIISDITKSLVFQITGAVSATDTDAIIVTINGKDQTRLSSFTDGKLTVTPDEANYWSEGILTVSISITDNSGHKTSKTFSYTIQPGTTALPVAKPASGAAPLTVTLRPYNTSNTAIEVYEWDFDGDGTFDARETVGRNQTRTFNTPGDYTVTLKLTDSEGKEVTGKVTIKVTNAPPIVSANAAPSNGPAPLTVSFSASAEDNEGIASYAWDFDGDGVFDLTDANATSTSHTYSTEGAFQPMLQVTDTLGETTDYAFDNIKVTVNPPGFPTVTASASPVAGKAPLDVSFSASSSATSPCTITRWEWDFEGDGTFDESSTTDGSVNHVYSNPGIYFAKIRVTDCKNQSAEDVIRIAITGDLSLSVSPDTIDTSAAETSTITTALSGDMQISLVIEDRSGRQVRTLVPTGRRSAGNYNDEWDGKDDQGHPVGEGEYHAVLLYELNGKQKRFDLSTSTGGRTYNPSRTGIPNEFQPFAGKPLVIDFTLPRASEVTAFMGRFNVDTRLITFMQRKPLGSGSHRITWNGEDSSGLLIHPPAGDSFLFGIFGFELPDNTIYVRSGAHVEDLTVSPSIFVPDSVSQPQSSLKFTLTGNADVRLLIYDADRGKLVSNKLFTGLAAGANEVTWDGKNNAGIQVAPGKYRLGLSAIDTNGFQSITQYVVQQVFY